MCGVVARLGIGNRSGMAALSVRRALDLMSHRGIRSRVTSELSGTVGHVRLPIVGCGREYDQPIAMMGGNLLVGFVGEILDFRETTDYQGEPCDVQTLERCLERDGWRGLQGRDGFWGIAAIDLYDDTLHVLTDYLAQKPMYYRADKHVQAAASEIDPLVSMGPVTFDELYFSDVIKWGYCPDTRRTPFLEIKHLLPGEHVKIDQHGQVASAIVDPLIPVALDARSLRDEIVRAIKRRVESSDVPISCLVSGGLDSAIAYRIGSRYADIRTYYATTAATDYEELGRVRDVLGDSPDNIVQYGDVSLEEALVVMQEPVDLGSLIPQVALSRRISETVCLTGDGADEVFGGYGRSLRYDSQWSDIHRELVAWHLPRLDRVMMRNCVEVRTPFLARRVVEAAMCIPHDLRRQKDMLKMLFGQFLPMSVLEAKKMPLRTTSVQRDREGTSKRMVQMFKSFGHYRPLVMDNIMVPGTDQ